MKDFLAFLREEKIVPVAVLEREESAVPVAEALLAGGIHSIEVTFRTKAAAGAIRRICEEYPDMVAGAGTILDAAQAREAMDAGAKFIVSPALIPEVITCCQGAGVPVVPGCVTPSEFLQAQKMGLRIAKFFPAEQYGGVRTLKAIGAVLPELAIMPTGGIHAGNIRDYLAYDKVCACGGSFMVEKSLVAAGEYGRITEIVKDCKGTIENV